MPYIYVTDWALQIGVHLQHQLWIIGQKPLTLKEFNEKFQEEIS